MFIDENGLHVYSCKDGRLRCYSPISKRVISYPRAIMEVNLGYPLKPCEQVHHKDNNPSNNDISNLEILLIGEHQKRHSQKYFDVELICPFCGKLFNWTAKQQQRFYSNLSRKVQKNEHTIGKPFCSKSCAGSYSRQEQLKRNFQAECGLNGESFPNTNPVPINSNIECVETIHPPSQC